MDIPLTLKADKNRVNVTAQQGIIQIEIDDALVYVHSKYGVDVILDTGNASANPNQLLAQSGFLVENFNANLIHPLDTESFSPKFAAAFAAYYGLSAYWKIRKHYRIAQLIDRCICDFEIKGYEAIPDRIHEEFVYLVWKTFPIRLNRLVINAQDTTPIHNQQKFSQFTIGALSAIYAITFFAVSGFLAYKNLFAFTSQDNMQSMIKLVLFWLVASLSAFAGLYLGAFLATLISRRFLSKVSLKLILEDAKPLPKAVINYLTRDV